MYGDGTIWYDKARKKYCYDYCDNDGKRHRKRFATEKEAKEFKKEIFAALIDVPIVPIKPQLKIE